MSRSQLLSYAAVAIACLLVGMAMGSEFWKHPTPVTSTRIIQTDRLARTRPDSQTVRLETQLSAFHLEASSNRHSGQRVRITPWIDQPQRSQQHLPNDPLETPSPAGANTIDSDALAGLGSSSRSSVSCLDSLIWSGDLLALGPDTITVCHNILSDSFNVSLRLARRITFQKVHFLAIDSTIYTRDSSLTVQADDSESLFTRVAKLLAAFAVGFFAGRLGL